MPENASITITVGSLPEGFCFSTWPNLFQTFTSLISGYLPGQYNTFNYGNTEPSADNRNKPWLRLNADGSPDRFYIYFGGSWVSPHSVPAGGSEIRMWEGLLADLESYDGGAPGVVTDTTGPMWEEVTTMRAKFPLGVGTLPVGTVVAVGDTGGTDQHTNTLANLPAHTHKVISSTIASSGPIVDADNYVSRRNNGGANDDYTLRGVSDEADSGLTSSTGGTSGDAVPFETLPPYRAIYFVRRSARIFFTP